VSGPANASSIRISMRGFYAALCVLLVGGMQGAYGQQDVRAVRAAFLYNLTQYVTWPQARSGILIGYLGNSSFGSALQKIVEGKLVDGRSIHVLLDPAAPDLSRCDVVYVSGGSRQTKSILDSLRGRPILTVGESEGFPRMGGMVGLVRVEDRIQLEINPEAARVAGLEISSRVLDLAVIVRPAKE
jgi:hypothetical protein